MDKTALRKKYLGLRKALKRQEVIEKSNDVFTRLVKLHVWDKTEVVACYLPINNEVETRKIIDFLISTGKRVILPKNKGGSYKFSTFSSWDDLYPGPFGILEPAKMTTGDDVDAAIIPGVAFDKNGIRLGYGKGVFDKLLSGSGIVKVGLAFELQVADELPGEKHDLVMNIIVTEKRTLRIT